MDRENVVELVAACVIKNGKDSGIAGIISKELADKMTLLFEEMYEWQNKNTNLGDDLIEIRCLLLRDCY